MRAPRPLPHGVPAPPRADLGRCCGACGAGSRAALGGLGHLVRRRSIWTTRRQRHRRSTATAIRRNGAGTRPHPDGERIGSISRQPGAGAAIRLWRVRRRACASAISPCASAILPPRSNSIPVGRPRSDRGARRCCCSCHRAAITITSASNTGHSAGAGQRDDDRAGLAWFALEAADERGARSAVGAAGASERTVTAKHESCPKPAIRLEPGALHAVVYIKGLGRHAKEAPMSDFCSSARRPGARSTSDRNRDRNLVCASSRTRCAASAPTAAADEWKCATRFCRKRRELRPISTSRRRRERRQASPAPIRADHDRHRSVVRAGTASRLLCASRRDTANGAGRARRARVRSRRCRA